MSATLQILPSELGGHFVHFLPANRYQGHLLVAVYLHETPENAGRFLALLPPNVTLTSCVLPIDRWESLLLTDAWKTQWRIAAGRTEDMDAQTLRSKQAIRIGNHLCLSGHVTFQIHKEQPLLAFQVVGELHPQLISFV